MSELSAQPGKVRAFALVRGADGKPKFDDIFNIPAPIWNMLTPEEQTEVASERHALSRNP